MSRTGGVSQDIRWTLSKLRFEELGAPSSRSVAASVIRLTPQGSQTDGRDRPSYRVTPRRQRSLRAPRTAETRLVSRRKRRLLALLRAPRGQRAALVGCPELVQTANGLAVYDDLGKARESSHLSKISLQLWVLCQVYLFEGYAALRKERLGRSGRAPDSPRVERRRFDVLDGAAAAERSRYEPARDRRA